MLAGYQSGLLPFLRFPMEYQLEPVFQQRLDYEIPLFQLDFAIGGVGLGGNVESVGVDPVGAFLHLNAYGRVGTHNEIHQSDVGGGKPAVGRNSKGLV